VLPIRNIAMNSNQGKNQSAFQAVKRELSSRYPSGRFVAFDDGQIVADAASFDELTAALAALGKDRPDVFVVQAGMDYPDEVFILL
jgi:hypothetical protein